MIEKYYITRKDNTDLNVYRCGFEECSPGYAWGPAVRDHYIIHYVLSGKGVFTLNGVTYDIKAGEGFLICPNHIISYQADFHDPWTYSWVGFHGLKAESILSKAGLNLHSPVFSHPETGILKKVLQDMITSAKAESASELLLTGHLFIFLSLLVKNHQKNKTPSSKKTGGDRYVSKAVDYIAKNYASKLTVNELSKALKIDRSYLSTLFSKYTGMSPQAFIIRYKMDKAGELLKNPLLSVGDVARSVGYDDQLQFSKTFKKAKGLPPAAFRKQPEA